MRSRWSGVAGRWSVLCIALVALAGGTGCLAGTWHDDATIEHDGLTRYYRYYTPDNAPPGMPVLFILHGGGGDMHGVMNNGANLEWPEIADEEGILLIVPNGFDPDTGSTDGDNQAWNDCRGDMIVRVTDADDVGLVNALIDWASANFDIDLDRVYSTGASNGGMMSYRLAFELGDRIAAVAAFIANLPAVDECVNPVRIVPTFICNGDAETHYMPWDGGCVTANSGCDRGTVISALETRDFWIGFNGCDPSPVETIDYPDLDPGDESTVTSDLYTGGYRGAEVMFYRVRGGGHTVPSIEHHRNPTLLLLLGLGLQNHDIESAREAWAFLSRHTLHGAPPGSPDPGLSPHLRVDKNPDSTLRLTWSADCGAGTAYGIYRGDLRFGYGSVAPEPGFCDVNGVTASIPAGEGPADFLLVVPNTGVNEGGYGFDWSELDRPAAANACYPRGGIDACAVSP
jgi:polyhydroxybutyrate depolymerase